MSDPNLAIQRQIQALQDDLERLRKSDTPGVEGTFTPQYEGFTTPGSWTYSVQTGFYTRYGNRVLFNLSLTAATRPVAPTGAALISHLPFTSDATTSSHSPVILDTVDAVTLSGTIVMLTARISPNTTYIELIEVLGTGPSAAAQLAATGLSATATIRVSGHYMI